MDNVRNPGPMTAAERMRRYRARQARGNEVAPKERPGPKTARSRRLGEATIAELVTELRIALTNVNPDRLRHELRRAQGVEIIEGEHGRSMSIELD